jgi:hypothetical protein
MTRASVSSIVRGAKVVVLMRAFSWW